MTKKIESKMTPRARAALNVAARIHTMIHELEREQEQLLGEDWAQSGIPEGIYALADAEVSLIEILYNDLGPATGAVKWPKHTRTRKTASQS